MLRSEMGRGQTVLSTTTTREGHPEMRQRVLRSSKIFVLQKRHPRHQERLQHMFLTCPAPRLILSRIMLHTGASGNRIQAETTACGRLLPTYLRDKPSPPDPRSEGYRHSATSLKPRVH